MRTERGQRAARQAIGGIVDEYVVAFLNAAGGSIYWGIRDSDRIVTGVSVSDKVRDQLKQVIGQKLSNIAAAVPPRMVDVPFHSVRGAAGGTIPDTCVVEVRVAEPRTTTLFLTGSGAAYRRTLGGVQKLSGAQLYAELAKQLESKTTSKGGQSLLASLPAVRRRAELVESIVRGRRVLWVDDHPSNNLYERVALAETGVAVDIAASSEEALALATYLRPDVIISDMEREGRRDAGLEFLRLARARNITSPVIFYLADVDPSRGVPPGAFALTNRPDEVLHLILDALERQR